jgi:hypothetical protein
LCLRRGHGIFFGPHEPGVRHTITPLRQDPDTGPAEPLTLQCPSTASAGRKLTRSTLGGSYGAPSSGSGVSAANFSGESIVPFFSSAHLQALPQICLL